MGSRGIEQGLLQRPTAALPALSETGRDDDRGPRALPSASTIPGTVSGGVLMTARSGTNGRASMLG